MEKKNIWDGVFDEKLKSLTIKEAIKNGYMQPVICGNVDKHSSILKMYGNYDNNYVLVGMIDGRYDKNFLIRFENFDKYRDLDMWQGECWARNTKWPYTGEKHFLDAYYNEFLDLPLRLNSKIVFFDISKNQPKFIDNLVIVPSCICVSDCNSAEFSLQTINGFVFNNLGKTFINNQTDLGKALTPKSVLSRAKTMLQILSSFNYALATEQDKKIMSALRKQTVDLLKENFTKERGVLMSQAKKEIGDKVTDALTFVETSGVMRSPSVLLRKDSVELITYLINFNRHIKKGSLTENIIYCEKVLDKFNERVDKRKQQAKIKKQIIVQKQNEKNKKFEQKNITVRDENYKL